MYLVMTSNKVRKPPSVRVSLAGSEKWIEEEEEEEKVDVKREFQAVFFHG